MIPVVADAYTLFGATTRGLLIHLDYQGSIRLHWSPLILEEMSRALVETGRKLDHASARRHEQLMRAALPGAEIPTRRVQAYLADVQQAMRSAPEPDQLLERLAADSQKLTAAALHDAWQLGAVRL